MSIKKHQIEINKAVEWAKAQELPDITELTMALRIDNLTGKQCKVLAVSMLPQCYSWSVQKKADIAGVSEKTWRLTLKNPKFQEWAQLLIRKVWGNVQLEMQGRYIAFARAGSEKATERILQQFESLDKPEKGGDTQVNVSISIIEQQRKDKIRQGLGAYNLVVDADS